MGELERKKIKSITIVGIGTNIVLLICKFGAGIMGRSGAMIADAVHCLSEFIIELTGIYCLRYKKKPCDFRHKYGYGKYETYASALIGMILLLVGIKLFFDGSYKLIRFYFFQENFPGPGKIAFIVALGSVIIKFLLYFYTRQAGNEENRVIRNIATHHREDAVLAIVTTLGIGGAIFLGKGWHILDAVTAIFLNIFVIRNAIRLIRPTADELLDRSLPPDTELEIMEVLMDAPGVFEPHHLCTRSIGNAYSIEAHICMRETTSVKTAYECTKEIETQLKKKFGQNTRVVLYVEPFCDGIPADCEWWS